MLAGRLKSWKALRCRDDRRLRVFVCLLFFCVCVLGTDACVTPVLSMEEAAEHPHNK